MKKLLLLTACLLLGSTLSAQSEKFRELEEQILEHYGNGEFEEILQLAPQLTKEEPWRGEGHYYSALAYIELKEYQKGLEYLELAEKQADPELRENIEIVRENFPKFQEQDRLAAAAAELEQQGRDKEAAALYKEAWELYKYSGATAEKAVILFLKLKDYEQAMSILEDPVFEGDPASMEYIEEISRTPEYKAIASYNEAISEGSLNFMYGEFEDALTNFDAALRLRPNDPDALQLKSELLDVWAWRKAEEQNTLKAYKSYLGNGKNLLYREEAEAKVAEIKQARRNSRPNKAFMTYVYDSIAPIGISFGGINNKAVGVYLSGNINNELLEGGVESSEEAGEEVPAYGDIVLGLTKKITYPLWIYAGGGAAFKEYYVEEVSEVAALADAGLILNLSGFVIRGGVKTDLEEYRFSAGIGFSF